MDNFFISLNAVFPFFVYLLFGFCLRKFKICDEEFLNKLNKVVFAAFFPFTMFNNVRNMDLNVSAFAYLIGCTLVVFSILLVLSLIIVPKLVKENAKRGVIIQALYRSNTLLYALPLAVNLFGDEGAGIASVVIAICIPIYNVVAIVLLEYYRGNTPTIKMLVLKVFQNPLLQGTLIGCIFALLKIQLPESVDSCCATISNLTTPLALMVLGGTTKLHSIQNNLKYIIPVLSIKMIFYPAIVLVFGIFAGLQNIELFTYFMIFATPVAVASYSMACNMGGDGQLAGEFVSISTIVSVLTLFLWIWFMSSVGLIYPM